MRRRALERACSQCPSDWGQWRIISPPGVTPASGPPTLLPAQPGKLLALWEACCPVPGLSLACLCSTSPGQLGPKPWLPSVCLLTPGPLMLPARSGVPAACPAACLPACSMPKLSACRLLGRTRCHWLAQHPLPQSQQPRGGCATWVPSPEGLCASWGPAPIPVVPSSTGCAGRLRDEPAGQRVALADLGIECGARQAEGWVPCPLAS